MKELATRAWQSILYCCDESEIEPGGNVKVALVAAKDLQRGSSQAGCGQSQRQSRNDLERRECAILSQAAGSDFLPGEFLADEGEHLVHRDAAAGLAYKSTNNLRCGFVLDQDEWADNLRLKTRPALPSEYLLRLGLQNVIFEDAIRLHGIAKTSFGIPSFHVSQPWIVGSPPKMYEVRALLEAHGFLRIPNKMMASGYADMAWYRTEDEILVYDTKPSNFVKTPSGAVLPIDLIVQIYPSHLLKETAERNGIDWCGQAQ